MSTFCGYFEDLKYVSVDRFEGNKNLEAKVYFLSHCHSDHMNGLGSIAFQERLLNNNEIFLYASTISVRILNGLYPNLVHKLKTVPLKDSILIEIPQSNGQFLTVSAIPAGHCPGSVMFLFESDKNILYTGDIRLNASDLEKYNTIFHKADNTKKKIDLMYLDTTFFAPNYLKFPTRSESLNTLIDLARNWISEGTNYVINLITSAKYGHEYLFCELSKTLKMPIHVNEQIFNVYKHIPDMDNIITRDGSLTQLHSSCMGYTKICLGHAAKNEKNTNTALYRIRNIKTCAWSFTNFKENNEIVKYNALHQLYRVCYSCHSSYEELVDFIKFFEPIEVKANVVPESQRAREMLYSYIDDVLSKLRPSVILESCTSNNSVAEDPLFDLGIKNNVRDFKHKIPEIDEDFLLDSPPKCGKRLRF